MIIYGKNAVKEAVRAGRHIFTLWLDEKQTHKEHAFKSLIEDKGIRHAYVSKGDLSQKAGNSHHQGFVANVEDYRYKTLEDVVIPGQNQVLLMLDKLEDPHNLGAIMRSAEATGMDGIIIPKNQSVSLSATVAKISTGAIEHVNVIQVTNLTRTITQLKSMGFWVVGADMDGATSHREIDVSTPLVIVIGAEGQGLSRLVKETCDHIVSIPMKGKINSLNASVTAALLMVEVAYKKTLNQ